MSRLEWSKTGRAELFAAYAKAQADMGEVIKNSFNSEFDARYANLAAVIAVVMPAMNKHQLTVIQSPSSDGETVSVETIVTHAAGGWLASQLTLRPLAQDPQGLASAITYARRYALMALAGVAPADDDGNAASDRGGPAEVGTLRKAATAEVTVLSRRRKSSAQAKRDGDFERLREQIARLESSAALDVWFALYQETEALTLPRAWADPVCDLIEARRNELLDTGAEAA